MKSHTECLICRDPALVDLAAYSAAHLCRCCKCGFVFARSIPTIQELEKHYEGYGRNDYLSPVTVKRYEELLDAFEPFRRTNRILDVGCGIGYFLEVAKRRGWEVHGTEFTEVAVTICRSKGINVTKGALSTAKFDKDFDVITSFEVIEHINTPREEVQLFYSLLRPGGLVYLTTPNFNSLLRYKLKANYNVICYPEHLAYFTARTITNLFEGAAFRKRKVEATGLSLSRLRASQTRCQGANISADSADERIRQSLERRHLQVIKYLLNALLSFLGVGDTLKCWFVKT